MSRLTALYERHDGMTRTVERLRGEVPTTPPHVESSEYDDYINLCVAIHDLEIECVEIGDGIEYLENE